MSGVPWTPQKWIIGKIFNWEMVKSSIRVPQWNGKWLILIVKIVPLHVFGGGWVFSYLSLHLFFYVTGSGKTDLMEIFAQIELIVPSECAVHCASIGAIDALIDACIAKLELTSFTVLVKHCFEHFIAQWLCSNDSRILYRLLHSRDFWHAHQWSEYVQRIVDSWQRLYCLLGRVY